MFLLHFPFFFFFVLLFFTNSVSLNWKWELDECGEPCLLSSAFLKDRLTTFAHEFCRWPGQEKSVIQEKLIPSFQMKCSLKRKPALSPGRGKHSKCGRSKMAVGLIWSSSGARWGQKELGVGQKSLWAGQRLAFCLAGLVISDPGCNAANRPRHRRGATSLGDDTLLSTAQGDGDPAWRKAAAVWFWIRFE